MLRTVLLVIGILSINLTAYGEVIKIGDLSIEVISNKIEKKDAKVILRYARTLYQRSAFSDCYQLIDKVLEKKNAIELVPEFYFVRAKCHFMGNHFRYAYHDFLKLYEQFPENRHVRKGAFDKTVYKATLKLVERIKTDYFNTTINYQDQDRYTFYSLDGSRFITDVNALLRFYALYDYIRGKQLTQLRHAVDGLLAQRYQRQVVLKMADYCPLEAAETVGRQSPSGQYIYRYEPNKYVFYNVFFNYLLPFYGSREELDYIGIELKEAFKNIEDVAAMRYGAFHLLDPVVVIKNPGTPPSCSMNAKPRLKKGVIDFDAMGLALQYDNKIERWDEVFDRHHKIQSKGKEYVIDFVISRNDDCNYVLDDRKDLFLRSCEYRMTFSFPPLKDLVLLKKGALFEWIGLSRSHDLL